MYTSKKIKKNYNYKPTKLMVVAHPDDETIFGGAQLLMEKNTWQLIVITNGLGGEEQNKDRQKNLGKAMKISHTSYEIWDHKDRYRHGLSKRLQKDFERYVKKHKYISIVSHNVQGEYGHPQHQDVSRLAYNTAKKFGILFGSFSHGKRLPKNIIKDKFKMFNCYTGVSKNFTKEVKGADGKLVNWFEDETIYYHRNYSFPKVIHQIWIGGKIPEHKKILIRHNKKMIKKSKWKYKLWGNKDLTRKNFPKTFKYIQKAKIFAPQRVNPNGVWAQISDLMRLEIIYRHGGFYLDTNIEILQPLIHLLPPEDKTMVVANQEPCDLNCKIGSSYYISNGFFGAIKKNYSLKRSISKRNLSKIDFLDKRINRSTGPYYFRKFLSYSDNRIYHNIYVLPYKMVYPFYPTFWYSTYISKKDKANNKCLLNKKPKVSPKNKKIIKLPNGKYLIFPCDKYPNSILINHTIGGSWSW